MITFSSGRVSSIRIAKLATTAIRRKFNQARTAAKGVCDLLANSLDLLYSAPSSDFCLIRVVVHV